jgi:hypothetical protein
MSQPSNVPRAFEHVSLRTAVHRIKKVLGIGRISAVARRVDQLAAVEPRVAQLEAVPSRIQELERRIEELEALCREQVGLQYLQLSGGAMESPPDAAFSHRRAK